MKIKEIRLENFGCYGGARSFSLPKLSALVGKNGTGKTTLLNAIRFCLTGAEPDSDIISRGMDECSATIVFEDPAEGTVYEFERIKSRTKPSKCKINGASTTIKAMNEKMADVFGIPLDRIKVISSGDVVAAMKPQEFSSFILEYIPEKLKIDDIMALVPLSTPGMLSIMEANLPEDGIDIAVIDEFYNFCKENRKELKASLQTKKQLLSAKPTEPPVEKEESLNERLNELARAEAGESLYKKQKADFDRQVEAQKKTKANIEALKKEIEAITVTRPDPAKLSKVEADINSANESIGNQKVSISGAQSAVKQLKITLEALESSVCPISPLITCHENKSVAKAEITESIKASEEGIEALKKELEKANAQVDTLNKERIALLNEKTLYEKKIALVKQQKALEDALTDLPEEPKKPAADAEAIAIEKFQIGEKLKAWAAYKEGVLLSSQISRLEAEVKDYDGLVKATAEKGEVRVGVIKRFLGLFEEIANKRSKELRPEVSFAFEPADGVTVKMDPTGAGYYYTYAELSGGERAYMIFVLLDLLNQLTGARLLFLDELSVMDSETFKILLELIKKHIEDYDHVIVSAVDHEDTARILTDAKVDRLTFLAS